MEKKRNLALLISIMIILLFAVVACSGGDDSPPAADPAQSEAPAQIDESTTDTSDTETETETADTTTDTATAETDETATEEVEAEPETAESEEMTEADETATEETAEEPSESEEESEEESADTAQEADPAEEETAAEEDADDTTEATTTTVNAGDGVYIVRAGDTLLSIGATLGVNWNDIAQLNDLEFPYTIYVGDELTLPETAADDTTLYTVEAGDTVYELSQEFGVSWSDVANINGLRWPYWIYVGQELIIPSQ